MFAVKRCSVCPLGVWTASYTETFRLACTAAHSLLRKVNWLAECLRCTLTSCLCTLSPHYFPLCFASVAQVVFCYTLCSTITTTTAGTVVNSQLCPVVPLSEGKRKMVGEKLRFHSMLLLLSCRGEWDVKLASFFGFGGKASIPGPEAFEEETAGTTTELSSDEETGCYCCQHWGQKMCTCMENVLNLHLNFFFTQFDSIVDSLDWFVLNANLSEIQFHISILKSSHCNLFGCFFFFLNFVLPGISGWFTTEPVKVSWSVHFLKGERQRQEAVIHW